MSWAELLNWLLGPKCRYGCGQRVTPESRAAHEDHDHRGDILPDWTTS